MNRTGLLIVLGVAAATGLLFGLQPELDLRAARYFYNFSDGTHNFSLRIYRPLMIARDLGLWISTLMVMPALAALAWKLIFPYSKLLIPGRAMLFLIATLALGPGLAVNVILKEHWGRSRPIDVMQFGGSERFVA
jgi:lipid A 4'-phosphatase